MHMLLHDTFLLTNRFINTSYVRCIVSAIENINKAVIVILWSIFHKIHILSEHCQHLSEILTRAKCILWSHELRFKCQEVGRPKR